MRFNDYLCNNYSRYANKMLYLCPCDALNVSVFVNNDTK